MFRKLLNRRLVITGLALALALGAVTGFVAQDTDAAFEEVEHVYFSDPSHTEIVGLWLKTCWGAIYSTGTRTPYKETSYIPCN